MFKNVIWLSVCLFALTACEVKDTGISQDSTESILAEISTTNETQVMGNEATVPTVPATTTPNPTNNMTKSDNQTQAVIKTNKGDIAITLYADKTPKTVENFVGLAKEGKYDNTIFHRVIENFMIQGGDYENRNGTGGQSIWGKPFEDEIVPGLSHVRGSLSMANAGPGTNGSQFFIVHAPETSYLDGRHTVFGQVTSGMEVVDAMAKVDTDLMDKPLEDIIIESIELK